MATILQHRPNTPARWVAALARAHREGISVRQLTHPAPGSPPAPPTRTSPTRSASTAAPARRPSSARTRSASTGRHCGCTSGCHSSSTSRRATTRDRLPPDPAGVITADGGEANSTSHIIPRELLLVVSPPVRDVPVEVRTVQIHVLPIERLHARASASTVPVRDRDTAGDNHVIQLNAQLTLGFEIGFGIGLVPQCVEFRVKVPADVPSLPCIGRLRHVLAILSRVPGGTEPVNRQGTRGSAKFEVLQVRPELYLRLVVPQASDPGKSGRPPFWVRSGIQRHRGCP